MLTILIICQVIDSTQSIVCKMYSDTSKEVGYDMIFGLEDIEDVYEDEISAKQYDRYSNKRI